MSIWRDKWLGRECGRRGTGINQGLLPPTEGHFDYRGCFLGALPGSGRGTERAETKGFQSVGGRRGEAPQADLGFPASVPTGPRIEGAFMFAWLGSILTPPRPHPYTPSRCPFSLQERSLHCAKCLPHLKKLLVRGLVRPSCFLHV